MSLGALRLSEFQRTPAFKVTGGSSVSSRKRTQTKSTLHGGGLNCLGEQHHGRTTSSSHVWTAGFRNWQINNKLGPKTRTYSRSNRERENSEGRTGLGERGQISKLETHTTIDTKPYWRFGRSHRTQHIAPRAL